MRYEIAYQPSDKQKQFHISTADEVLFGGAAGGGKSMAVVMEALQRCLEAPDVQAYLFRRTYPELRDTLIKTAQTFIPNGLGKWRGSSYDWTFPNGSAMHFRHCQGENDVYRYLGVEIHALFIDELTRFTKTMYDYLKTRLRVPKRVGAKPVVRCTTNPGGIGHGWVKQYFVDAGEPYQIHERIIHSEAIGQDRRLSLQYIPALVTDNPYIGDEYIFELETKPKALRDALLYGRWDAFEGQVFMEWTDSAEGYKTGLNTHVIDPLDIPPHWPRYRSFDWGYAKPFSVLWWTVDHDGRVYLYREWYGCTGEPNEGLRMDVREVGREIKRLETFHGESQVTGYADPSIWTRNGGESIAEQLEAEGVYFFPADNERMSGKMQVHYRLRMEDGRPMMQVFNTCKHFIRTISQLVYSNTKPEDVDTMGEDHSYDAMRYFLMSRPVTPKRPVKIRREFNPLE